MPVARDACACQAPCREVPPLAVPLAAPLPLPGLPRPLPPRPSLVAIVRLTPLTSDPLPARGRTPVAASWSPELLAAVTGVLSQAPVCNPLGVQEGGSPVGAAPTSGAAVPPSPKPAATSTRMPQMRARGSSPIVVSVAAPAIRWWRQRSCSLAHAVSTARLMLVTCRSRVCGARITPGMSWASQKDSSRSSTRVCRLRRCRECLATERWVGVTQLHTRVLST